MVLKDSLDRCSHCQPCYGAIFNCDNEGFLMRDAIFIQSSNQDELLRAYLRIKRGVKVDFSLAWSKVDVRN